MRVVFATLLAFLVAPALAASELQLESNTPVNLFIDGENVGKVRPHEPLLVDIEGGVHTVQIRGMLGKELYNRDLIFDDRTRTELVWQRDELRLGRVVKLEAAPAGEQVASTPPTAAPPATPPAPPAPAPAPPAPAAPAPPASVPPAPSPPAAPAPAPQQVVVVQQPAVTASGALVIQATENLDLQIVHGTQLLRIAVENGELVLRDSSGTEIRFPKRGQAF